MMIAFWIAAILLVSVAAAEIACRLWFRHAAWIYFWPPYFHAELEMDARILPNLPAHAAIRVNSLGARGDEPPPPRTKTFRILACGGSGVECFSLDQGRTWPQLVQEFLAEPENLARLGVARVYAANIGRSGVTTDTLVYALPRILSQFGPVDVLTIMIGTSAVNSWTRIGTPAELPPATDPPWEDVAWHSEHVWSWTPRKTALAELVRRSRQCIFKPTMVRKGAGRRFAQSREMRKKAREIRTTFGDPSQWLAHYENTLAGAVELARPYARRIVLIRQPWFDKPKPTAEEEAMFWHGSVGDASTEFADVFYSHAALCAMMQLIDEATIRVGNLTGADVLHPAEAIEASARTYYDHFHLTAEGAALLGDHVGRQILALETRESEPIAVAACGK